MTADDLVSVSGMAPIVTHRAGYMYLFAAYSLLAAVYELCVVWHGFNTYIDSITRKPEQKLKGNGEQTSKTRGEVTVL